MRGQKVPEIIPKCDIHIAERSAFERVGKK